MTDQVVTLGAALMSCVQGAVALMEPAYRPQNICFRVGTEIAHDASVYEDLCCEGLAYVSLGDIFPSSVGFPETDIVRQANTVCSPPAWGVQFRTGMVVCAPVMGPTDGSMPTCEQWTAAYLRNLAVAEALRRISCCFRAFIANHDAEFLGMSTVIGRQIQGNPLGGCVERYVTLDVQMANCDCLGQL